MTNKMTITKALQFATSPELLEAQEIEVLQEVVEVITASTNKRALKKLDIVKGVLANKKKSGADTEKIEQIENSIKDAKKTVRPIKKDQVAGKPQDEQAELPLEEEVKVPAITADAINAMNGKELKALAKAQGVKHKPIITNKALQAILLKELLAIDPPAEEEKEEEKEVEVESFPDTIQEGKLKKISLDNLKDAILETPYKVLCMILEKGETTASTFLVTYANSELVVLVDISVEVNAVIPFSTKSFNKKNEVKMDGTYVPVAFYQPTK